ncbi:succinate dehydrogenase, cytochrome b556 subunit [Consotaella salsifontis]|uniref:Succinate dehydrogenase cytochrome b556 subunit n=1 Tax=Consotaella salsifontis TaxID=1365950 RepID=A0A1T4RXN1_9HYPH|nr:succinate dehydrogenase, cytochrome b556 subunit [Consotaella salsifontis]SKA20713.1 succinate dehydrogenase subunit C [Consotaella salsifontis]
MSQIQKPRPLSPHIMIYRLRMTMLMSGFHRATGLALYFGMVFLTWWLVAAASGPNAFGWASWFFGSFLGYIVMLGFSWGLIHHAVGGVRHLIWDLGIGLSKEASMRWAIGTIIASVAITILLWLVVLIVA